MSETHIMALVNAILEPEFNSRSEMDQKRLEAFAVELKRDGLQTPIGLQRLTTEEAEANPGKRWRLEYGSRRLAAFKLNGKEEIPAVVREPTDRKERVMRNAIENAQREDLSTFDQARTCAQLREEGIQPTEASERLGWSKQFISNLTVTYLGLSPKVRGFWQAASKSENANDPALKSATSVNYLRELVKEKDPAVQEANFAARLAELREFYSDGKKKGKSRSKGKGGTAGGSTTTRYSISGTVLAELKAAIKKQKDHDLALQVVRFIGLEIKSIKGVYDPKAE